jgi:hypothetical protein
MPAPMTAPVLLSDLVRRGFTLRAVAGRLAVSPATALTASDREAIRERREELLTTLSLSDCQVAYVSSCPQSDRSTGDGSPKRVGEAWNRKLAIRLMYDADTLVERSEVSGRHPAVADAAAMVASAFASRDMETLRFALAEFAVLIRQLACERVTTGGARQTEANLGGKLVQLAEKCTQTQSA